EPVHALRRGAQEASSDVERRGAGPGRGTARGRRRRGAARARPRGRVGALAGDDAGRARQRRPVHDLARGLTPLAVSRVLSSSRFAQNHTCVPSFDSRTKSASARLAVTNRGTSPTTATWTR